MQLNYLQVDSGEGGRQSKMVANSNPMPSLRQHTSEPVVISMPSTICCLGDSMCHEGIKVCVKYSWNCLPPVTHVGYVCSVKCHRMFQLLVSNYLLLVSCINVAQMFQMHLFMYIRQCNLIDCLGDVIEICLEFTDENHDRG